MIYFLMDFFSIPVLHSSIALRSFHVYKLYNIILLTAVYDDKYFTLDLASNGGKHARTPMSKRHVASSGMLQDDGDNDNNNDNGRNVVICT